MQSKCSLCCSKRNATKGELKWLEEHAFIVTDTGVMLMAEVDKLAGVLEEFDEMNLSATLAFLKGMPPMEGNNGSSSSSTTGSMFPDSIPTCTISPEELEGPYSITSIAPQLCKKGSMWKKQVAALVKWKLSPPLNSHDRVKQVGDTSIQLMIRSLEEYVGYCYLHHNKEPNMDLVMECNTFSKFMAFKEARDNESNTLLRAAQQVSMVVPFVMSGHCPQAKAYGAAHAAQCKQWYSNLKSNYREQVAATPAKRSSISLALQWEMVDAEWHDFDEKYKVSIKCMHWMCVTLRMDPMQVHLWHTKWLKWLMCVGWLQANNNTMHGVLARECLDAGLSRWLSGRDCPPPRVGALGAIHKWNKLDGVECVMCG